MRTITSSRLLSLLLLASTSVYSQQEVGINDFRISDAGGTGNPTIDATGAAIAYNSSNHEYLVVWHADDVDTIGIVDGETEIFAQRIDATTGLEIGTDFRISDAGGTGNAAFDAVRPAVAYNSDDNQYLVVWQADDRDAAGVSPGEEEIYGQRLDASTGQEIGANDFRISDAGGSGDANTDARGAAVTYNSVDNEYLVIWIADDIDVPGISSNEFEVFGQRITANTGIEVGENDFRITDVGGDGNSDFGADSIALEYNPDNNEYLVVWQADDTDQAGIIDNEFEIYGQRLDGATGQQLGENDFRISDAGGTGDESTGASSPDISYNPVDNEYLVVWQADHTQDVQIFGQRLDASTGEEVGSNDFQISDVSGFLGAGGPRAQFNRIDGEYLVVWQADDQDIPGITNFENEIFAQRINATDGTELGVDDFRISDVGGTGNSQLRASDSDLAFNPVNNQYLVVWSADDTDEPGIVNDESEIYGQLINSEDPLVNQPPTFTLGADQVIINTGGVQSIIGFITDIDDGDPDLDQTVSFELSNDNPSLFSVQPEINDTGDLSYTPAADTTGFATITVTARDNGGTQNGGKDTSEPQAFTITILPIATADLAINKTHQKRFLENNEVLVYTITVENLGPEDVTGATVKDLLPDTLINAQWTCAADPGALCTAGGSGDIVDTVDIPATRAVTYTLITEVIAEEGSIISNTATVTPPTTPVDPNPGNNTATDSDSVALFTDGFEG